MNQLKIYTIGYENSNIEDFINKLDEYNIDTIVDIREIPASRKPGFSKNKLKGLLESANKKYIHKKNLGSPKELRKKLYIDSDYNSFFIEYRKHLKNQIESIEELHEKVITNETICLMCFEKIYSKCHRSIVAEEIKSVNGNGLIITHL